MISGERNDFFVFRKQRQTGKGEEIRNVVSIPVKGIEIDKSEIDYIPLSDNISRVRIPAILYIINRMKNDEYYIFKNSDRKQVGSHLFATNRAFVSYLKTYLDENRQYHVSSTSRIHAVYPCFLKIKSGHRMCIGLRYSLNMSEGHRTFGRTIDNQSPSGGVFDLMEEFLNSNRIKKGIESEENRKMFPKEEHHYAIYVGAGAKLIVQDNRSEVLSKKLLNKSNYTSSLFQPGSLVVFSGHLNLELPVGINNETLDQKGVKKISFEWKESIIKGLLAPEDSLHQNWFKYRGLDKCKEYVIFLGHNPSQSNSVCWRLRLDWSKQKQKGRAIAALTAPEGGRIIDIQTWDWGWAEIYWRHRYERLYEKVLFASDPSAYVQKDYFNFHIPTVSGSNPYYWEMKILGIGANFSSWRIKFPYQYEDQKALSFPSFTERPITYNNLSSVHPFSPPLYPPIYSENQFLYLPYKTNPKYLSDSLFEISENIFKMTSGETDEYLWSDPKRVAMHPNLKLSPDQRLGLDLMVYSKQNVVIGRKRIIYFETNSLNTKDIELKGSLSTDTKTETQKEQLIEVENIESINGKLVIKQSDQPVMKDMSELDKSEVMKNEVENRSEKESKEKSMEVQLKEQTEQKFDESDVSLDSDSEIRSKNKEQNRNNYESKDELSL